jgi:protein-tyrosine phosphatase
LSVKSPRKISENDLNWASLVLVMENNHRAKIKEVYSFLDLPPIEVLGIPDDYEFMDVELIEILEDKINAIFNEVFGISFLGHSFIRPDYQNFHQGFFAKQAQRFRFELF